MKERILIGEELQVRFRLQGDMDADVLCDTTRPLGTFLAEFEHDPDGEWNRLWPGSAEGCPALKPLEAASLRAGRRGISENKFDTGDPLRMYAAFRIWNGYLLAREPAKRAEACDRFMDKMSHFTMTFQQRSRFNLTAITVGRSRSIFPAGYSAPYRQRKHGLTFGIRTTGVRQNVSRPIPRSIR